jgi:Asp-tRNA(Asn)/Glu-tRNA(Gln) amidotransferase C subunit
LTAPQISKDALKAAATMSGLNIGDESLDQLLPQIQRSAELMERLDSLDLKDVEPAVIFSLQPE